VSQSGSLRNLKLECTDETTREIARIAELEKGHAQRPLQLRGVVTSHIPASAASLGGDFPSANHQHQLWFESLDVPNVSLGTVGLDLPVSLLDTLHFEDDRALAMLPNMRSLVAGASPSQLLIHTDPLPGASNRTRKHAVLYRLIKSLSDGIECDTSNTCSRSPQTSAAWSA
jgi:hypothetical protein